MQNNKLSTLLLLTFVVLAVNACSDLENSTSSSSSSLNPFAEHVYTASELFPEGDAETLVLLPRSGWVAEPFQEVFFKALLLNPETGVYTDVTNDDRTKWQSTMGGGSKMFNGADPRLPRYSNAEVEITFSIVFDKKVGAQTVGKYHVPAEYEWPEHRNE